MSLQDDLLHQARQLATHEPKRPKQASLRRAVSAAYYALFHLLTSDGAAALSPLKEVGARAIIARSFQHKEMVLAATSVSKGKLPKSYDDLQITPSETLRSVADAFRILQDSRHEADYNVVRSFTRAETLTLIARAEQAFKDWRHIRGDRDAKMFLQSMLLKGR
jgi:uncharacterized protein (UPF0332 family)